jgi:hypothetical protein
MATVTSETLADYNQDKMEKDKPEGYVEEPNNGAYNKHAKKADELSQVADDLESHRDAYREHRLAQQLAQMPDNRAYHRTKWLEHEETSDKLERQERRDSRRDAAKVEAAKARARYEAATRTPG